MGIGLPETTRALRESGTQTANDGPGTAQPNGIPNGGGRYEILRRIGEGGMGVVYEAIDRERMHPVALKSLLHFTPAALYRFKQEFRTLADVHHPNLVRLHELVVTGGADVFFTMELVNGTDFLSYVQLHPRFEPDRSKSHIATLAAVRDGTATPGAGGEALAAPPPSPAPTRSPADFSKLRHSLRQLVEGLLALHSAGKLHRDVKPTNILVTPEGRVVILDFGVATEIGKVVDENLSEAPEIVGTVRYMSPEQAVAEDPTAASDWYSVGVVLYEALVGRAPFTGSAIDLLTTKTLNDPLPPAACVEGVPDDLNALCVALLDRNPTTRPLGPEILSRLDAASPSVRPAATPSLMPEANIAKGTTLVGREGQLEALQRAFDQVVQGQAVTVRVAGASGMGKSVVAQHFLDGLVERGEAVALRGRAYERESVPYKAVDSVVDALSRYLVHLEDANEPVELPKDIGALARVFPVLRRVASIGALPQGEGEDPQLVRRRAFAALRQLLGTIAAHRPLVVFIDDVQWGDTDSAGLLLEIVRPPAAPPLLLLMTQREEEAQASAFLREMRTRWPQGAEAREVAVGPLSQDESKRLALTLLSADDELAQRTARAAARESRGSPFLVEELVRSNMGNIGRADGATLAVLTLGQMVARRLDRLPEPVRRMLEIVAVSGRPLPVPVVADAAGLTGSVDDAIAIVRARRFVRTGLRDGKEVIETSHDRFRETIVSQLSDVSLREHHGRLAHALEGAPGADAEAVAMHLLAAGDEARAAVYAERAAEEAFAKLAFDQAVRLFRMALDTMQASADETRRVRTRLAMVLEWAGRGEEAARVYLEAADGAPALERAELERCAAIELLSAGRLMEGTSVLHRALGAVGLKAPGSTLAALFWLLVYRIRIAILSKSGFKHPNRPPNLALSIERARVDAAFAAAIGLAFTNVFIATCMSARSLLLALRFGDGFQIMRAAVVESSNQAGIGGNPSALERSLVALAGGLAEKETTDRPAQAFFDGNHGVSVYLRGEWKKALEALDASTLNVSFHDHRAGWQTTARVFACWSLNFLGRHRELSERMDAVVADAEQRGDRHTLVQLRDGSLAILWLVKDDPQGARAAVDEAMALWPNERYTLQHWHRLYGEGEIELYVGDGAKAYARMEQDAKALGRSLILTVQHMRVQTAFLRGRCAIASIEAEPAYRSRRLGEVRKLAHKLEREGMKWSAPFAAILRAGASNAAGDRATAAAELRSAIDRAHTADMAGYATAARHQLGCLLGGDEGTRLVADAERAMRDQGIVQPARFASTLVPGRWRSE
ncbi:MAG TPA: protein kinase [Polyangiaceae bacterium]|nr:protein kinase [Polyangiaceae bacterium]